LIILGDRLKLVKEYGKYSLCKVEDTVGWIESSYIQRDRDWAGE